MTYAMLRYFWKDESGLSAVEYAIAGALVIATGSAAFTALGIRVDALVGQIATAVGTAP